MTEFFQRKRLEAPRLGVSLEVDLVPPESFDAIPPMPTLARGLGYIFPEPTRARFWTLGSETSLEQVFVHASGAIVQILERTPEDPTVLGPETDVRAVFEFPLGTCARLGLAPGERLALDDVFAPDADPGLIAIVQSDRAGWYLACELRARGHRIVHVHHVQHLEEVPETEFDLELIYVDDLDEILAPLIALGPRLVLPGSELGVNPADYLAEALCLPGNGTRLSVARRDKAGMVEAVKAAGLPTMRQLRSKRASKIAAWKARHHLDAVVIKPLRSAGTDRVAKCRTEAEIRVAVASIKGHINRLGLSEDAVLAQEHLEGPEIYLNSTSRNGRHAVTEIWLETKRDAPAGRASDGTWRAATPFAYDTFELLPGDDPLARHLTAWLGLVLDGLGLRWGPAHTELILTPRGPRLIDFGARLDGVLLPALNEECLGKSPVQLTADAYLDPGAWEAWAAGPYRLAKHATMVVVDNPRAGRLRDDSGLRALSVLPSFHALRPRWNPGEDVPESRDAFTYHSIVTLVHEDLSVVRRDALEIRAREREHLLLDVAPLTLPSPPVIDALDPRTTTAWGEALESLGWRQVFADPRPHEDAPALFGYLKEDRDGTSLWIPRQGDIDLLRIDGLARSVGAVRTIIEPAHGARIRPLLDPDFELPLRGADMASVEARLEEIGLVPTLHAHSSQVVETIATADLDADPEVVVEFGPLEPDIIEAVFRVAGAHETSRWPRVLSETGGEDTVLARIFGEAGQDGVPPVRAASLAFIHDGVAHVAAAVAQKRSELKRLLSSLGHALASHEQPPSENTNSKIFGKRDTEIKTNSIFDLNENRDTRKTIHYLVHPISDKPLGLGTLEFHPPALRWRRPEWVRHLASPEGVLDAVFGAGSDHDEALAVRLARRRHPLSTPIGGTWAQSRDRLPLLMTAHPEASYLFRERPGDHAHAVALFAPRFDIESARRMGDSRDLLWVAWEPPLVGLAVTSHGEVELAWDPRAPEAYLRAAARLGLVPVRSRWTRRHLDVVGLDGEVPAPFEVPGFVFEMKRGRLGDRLEGMVMDLDVRCGIDEARARNALAMSAREDLVTIVARGDEASAYVLAIVHDKVITTISKVIDPDLDETFASTIDEALERRLMGLSGEAELMVSSPVLDDSSPSKRASRVLMPPTLALFLK